MSGYQRRSEKEIKGGESFNKLFRREEEELGMNH